MTDQIIFAEQMSNYANVGCVAADHRHTILDADKGGQSGFKLTMQLDLTRNYPARRNRCPECINCLFRLARDVFISGKREIIITAEIDEVLSRNRSGSVINPVMRCV